MSRGDTGNTLPVAFKNLYKARNFVDGGIDVLPLALQYANSRPAFLNCHSLLRYPAIVQIIKVDHFAYIGEAEPDALPPQNPRKPRPVPLRIDPRQSPAFRRHETFILVETQRTRCNAKFFAEVRNGVLAAFA